MPLQGSGGPRDAPTRIVGGRRQQDPSQGSGGPRDAPTRIVGGHNRSTLITEDECLKVIDTFRPGRHTYARSVSFSTECQSAPVRMEVCGI